MATTSHFVLRVPIHGYSGMGYESHSHLTKTYANETEARKWFRRYSKAWELTSRQDKWYQGQPDSLLWTDREEAFMREMSEVVSFSFRGPPTLSRATITEEWVA